MLFGLFDLFIDPILIRTGFGTSDNRALISGNQIKSVIDGTYVCNRRYFLRLYRYMELMMMMIMCCRWSCVWSYRESYRALYSRFMVLLFCFTYFTTTPDYNKVYVSSLVQTTLQYFFKNSLLSFKLKTGMKRRSSSLFLLPILAGTYDSRVPMKKVI